MIFLSCQKMFSYMLCVVDWGQFLQSLLATMIGCIIGIIGPFIVQYFVKKYTNKNKAFKILERIKGELKNIKTNLEDLAKADEEDMYLDPIDKSIWIELQNTNEVSLLLEIYDSENKELGPWLEMIYSTYYLIDTYNKYWNLYSQNKVLLKLLATGSETQEGQENNKKTEQGKCYKRKEADVNCIKESGIGGIAARLCEEKIFDKKENREVDNKEQIDKILAILDNVHPRKNKILAFLIKGNQRKRGE